MAFQFTDQGPQYHEPVAPITPTVHPLPPAPEQIGASIVHAFVSRAIAAEQAQVDQQRMMQTADLQAQHLAYQDKWNTQDYKISQQNADSLDALRSSEVKLNEWKLEDDKQGAVNATDAALEFAKQKRALQDDFASRATSLGVNDLKTQANDPVGFSDAVTALHQEYMAAPTATGIPAKLKQLQTLADQQKSTIVLDDKTVRLSYGQIMTGLRNPDTHDTYYNGLKDAGHITPKSVDMGPATSLDPMISLWDKVFQKHEFKQVQTPDAMTQKIIDQQARFDPYASQSRVPENFPTSALDLRAQRQGQPTPVAPTETDTVIARAKAAIAAGKDPNAVRAVLQSQGIDPTALDQ